MIARRAMLYSLAKGPLREAYMRCFAIFLLSASTLLAQSSTATLFGVVRDSSGGVLPQAEISATHVTTSITRKAATDGKGEYLITNLPIGEYSLTVENAGFRRFIQTGITLEVN